MVYKYFPEGFSPGSVVTVKGYVLADPDRFEINFQCGPMVPPDIVSDIALHFNPRFDEDTPVIIRNTKTNGKWGYEEKDGGFFFSSNHSFYVQISSEQRGYKIVVDDFPFIYFKHRQDLSAVTHMTVLGDIEVREVCYNPTPRLEEQFYVPKPAAPVKFLLEDQCFKLGSTLEIKGKVRSDISRFSVNLVCGKNPENDHDICCPATVAMHYDVRFLPSNEIIRNTMIDGEWGNEETDAIFVFSRERNFTLCIKHEEQHFQIFVNQFLNATYKHRISPQNVSYIYIHGEIHLFSISVKSI